jgi:glycosyltransferase involved in cell wall biosynthesis
MKQRVLFLHQNAVLGGAEMYLIDVARHYAESSQVVLFGEGPLRATLEDAGVNVRVAATSWAQQGVRGGKPRPSMIGTLQVLLLASQMAALARRHDLIFANSPKAMTVAWLAGRMARRSVIWAFHDLLHPAHFSNEAIRQMVRNGNAGACRVIACSRAGMGSLNRYGLDAARTCVVYYGIRENESKDDEETVQALRRELQITKEGQVAGVFGRITDWKGQHVAVELLGRLPHLQLILVGGAEEQSYLHALKARASELGATDRFHVLGHRGDVSRLMRGVDVVLHTSIAPEPFGRVVVEALLAGKPVIATSGGGIAEIIDDRVTGILVPPGDVDALTAAVLNVLTDTRAAAAMAERGRVIASARFSLSAMMEQLDGHISEAARK